jgi:dihydroneopterin aldolase
MDKVRLRNMVFYGYHGIAEQEKELGGKFEIDLEMGFDITPAMKSDKLHDTINYESVYKLVNNIVTESKFHLIEALAGKILSTIFNVFPIETACVRVRKPNAPVKGILDFVEIEITRTREEMKSLQ